MFIQTAELFKLNVVYIHNGDYRKASFAVYIYKFALFLDLEIVIYACSVNLILINKQMFCSEFWKLNWPCVPCFVCRQKLTCAQSNLQFLHCHIGSYYRPSPQQTSFDDN